jgi:hypothetical protein
VISSSGGVSREEDGRRERTDQVGLESISSMWSIGLDFFMKIALELKLRDEGWSVRLICKALWRDVWQRMHMKLDILSLRKILLDVSKYVSNVISELGYMHKF